MAYPFLATLFFLSMGFCLLGAIYFLTPIGGRGRLSNHRSKIVGFYILWFTPYVAFVLFFTGPRNLDLYPESSASPYKLPWRNGVARFVSQGNRSFTSHRDFFEYAWDFWMPTGTEILASRAGRVVAMEEDHQGIGFSSNYVTIEHSDGTRAMYAHIRHHGTTVKMGAEVKQGQLIAYSGMVGQTINPHLHFSVINKEGTRSLPIAFSDVTDGVPLAGRFYTSGNGNP